MANYLTHAINQFLDREWTVLDLCCGNGLVSDGFVCKRITGVDVYQPYLDQYRARVRNAEVLQCDLRTIAQVAQVGHGVPPKSFDVVVCADGVEHLEPAASLQLIEWMERVARQRVIVFTPLNVDNPGGIVLNTPHNAWGIEGGNDWQAHRCGYAPDFFLHRGYQAYRLNVHANAYDGTPYAEMLYVQDVPSATVRVGAPVQAQPAVPPQATRAFGWSVPAGVGP